MFHKYCRTIAAVVLCFFTWTSGGVFSVAHAAVDGVKKGKAQAQQPKKAEGPEERFGKATEGLTTALADPRATVAAKRERLKSAQGEIAALDPEVRKSFAATEKRLKDAKLPAVILERHYKFVKHYDDNLAKLQANMATVAKARDDKEAAAALDKTRQHLEKVKAPSRHQKLDPNNLPHRQPKVIKREPRPKKEDFERDLKRDKHAWQSQKRIMVASVGSLAGLLSSSTVTAIAPPTDADLAETIDVQLTPEIRAKAQELEYKPVKIYEWVRNNVEFVPTWGSIQGAQMTLLTKQGNAFDTASLLIALLRASGIHARYVMGTVELPIDKVMNWAGGFTDPLAALDFMNSGGIPTTALTSGGQVVKARLEHVWVEAWINYRPSRGARHINGKGDTWIRLDPSYKQYNYTSGIDVKSAVPFDAQSFLTQIQSGATINATDGSVTGVNSLAAQQAMQDYQTRVQNYIQLNYPNATVGDVLGKKEIAKKEYPFLLGTLPYSGAIRGTVFTEIPDSLRHKLTFSVTNGTFDETPLAITKSLAELAGKKITLSYTPATPQDEAVINSFFPQPHADGTPIQPSELPSSLPAYLVNVKPELRIDGQVVATGATIGLGSTESFVMSFYDPSTGDSLVTNTIDAGVCQAIALNLGRISQDQLTNLKTKLEATKTKLQNNDFASLSKDDLIGDLLYTTALSYHAELGTMNFIAAKIMGVNSVTLPSETIFATQLKVASMWGIPRSVSAGGLNMDADRLLSVVKAKDGDNDTVRQYMLNNGMISSALEHSVPEQLFSTPENQAEGVSAVKALKIANDQGIPIYTINQTNIATTLPQLQVSQEVKMDIQNAVNADKVVTVSQANINFKGWIGCGYIITNPETGAGAYMISGGLSGAMLYTYLDMMNPLCWASLGSNVYDFWSKEIPQFLDYYLNMPDQDLAMLKNNASIGVGILSGISVVLTLFPVLLAGAIPLSAILVPVFIVLSIIAIVAAVFVLNDPYKW
ncbi:MAG TPA: transglutaminase domain-containing protein [Geobacteraceae bacterium]